MAQLPNSIEAVFYVKGGTCSDGQFDGYKCEDYARKAHTAIAKHFGLGTATGDAALPLLQLDVYNWTAPFSPAPPPGGGGAATPTAGRR